jgi:uncharacterized membrane protein (DUF106 family)
MLYGIPNAVFLFMLSGTIAFLTSLANRLLSNPEQNKIWRKEIAEWNSELRKARKEGDKKQIEKLMKKQQYIFQIQGKMTWSSMKVSLIFIVPLFIVWNLLGSVLSDPTRVALFPGVGWTIPVPYFGGSIIWWYLLSSMFFGTIFSHVFGLTTISE